MLLCKYKTNGECGDFSQSVRLEEDVETRFYKKENDIGYISNKVSFQLVND